jgi:pimeloyl-ACP methyl ester carboxylesterase
MANPILVPQVGQDLTEAKVVELHVKLGDKVRKGDLVAVVESEKASFDVEAFAAGTVIELRYQAGDTATVLEPLLILGEEGEAPAAGEGAAPVQDGPKQAAPAAAGNIAQAPKSAAAIPPGATRASPAARREAASRNIALEGRTGSGPDGAIVLRDLDGLAGSGSVARQAGQAGSAIAVRTLREGTGHPILFLHGFGADISSWRAFAGRVSLGNPIIALDLPGHGASAAVGASGFDAMVDRIAEALVAAGHMRLHLVGHSLGAAAAAALSARGDVDVRSLTLLSPAGLGVAIDGAFIEGFLGAKSEVAIAAWMARLVSDPGNIGGAMVRATAAAREGTGLVEAQSALARAVFEGSTQLFSIRDALARFAGPCRVVVGRDDTIVSPAEIERALPGHVALHRLQGTGHLPQVEAVELVARLVSETVRSVG